MDGNMIWGEKQAEAIRRISEQAYELTKDIDDHNQYEEFTKRMEEAGFVFDFKGNDPSVNVCVTICTDVWNRLMKEGRVAKVNETTRAMNKIDEKSRGEVPDWRAAIAKGKVAKQEKAKKKESVT
jgi:hypothetical protein